MTDDMVNVLDAIRAGGKPECGWEDATPIPGTSDYRISKGGRVWSKAMGEWRELYPTTQSTGYLYCKIKFSHGWRLMSIHRLLLLTFVGPCPPRMQGLHRDDNKLNNELSNLRYGTSKENHADAIRNGRKPRGEKNANAKLTVDRVRVIRKRLADGVPERAIAKEFGVSRNPIRDIKFGITWRHVA